MPDRRARYARTHRQGAGRQDHRDRHRASAHHRPLSLGRTHRPQAAARGHSRDRRRAIDAGVHQRALRHRDLVPGDPRGTAGLGGTHCPASRIAGTRCARLGRGRPAPKQAEGRRLHVEPRPGRRLHAGGPGAADRLAQGRRAAAAARGPQRPPAGGDLQGDDRAGAGAGTGRSRGGARRGAGAQTRAAHAASLPARRAGPAPGHVRARRRLRAGGTPGGTSRHARLRGAVGRAMAMGAGLRRARRRQSQRVSGVSPRRDRRRWHRARAGRCDRAPASRIDRHHRVRGQHQRAVPQRPQAGPRRGIVHRAARRRRLLRVRRAGAGIRARQGDDGVGDARPRHRRPSSRAGWAARWRCRRCSPTARAA